MKALNLSIVLLLIFSSYLSANDLIINRNIKYPYKATEERANKIKSGYMQIKTDMAASEVISILGTPDETLHLYEPIKKNPNHIGYTHWYLVQRLQKVGSVNEKQEKLLRVSYDLKWKVTDINYWDY